jgi:hypothetical protein
MCEMVKDKCDRMKYHVNIKYIAEIPTEIINTEKPTNISVNTMFAKPSRTGYFIFAMRNKNNIIAKPIDTVGLKIKTKPKPTIITQASSQLLFRGT